MTPYRPFEFEGRPTPPAEGLAHALCGTPERRAWLVRAAVVDAGLAVALEGVCSALVCDAAPVHISVGLEVARALLARPVVDAVVAAYEAHPARFVGVPDPHVPGRTLAQSALELVTLARPRRHAGAARVLRAALAVPEVRLAAWKAIGQEEGPAVVQHLAALLTEHPELAPAAATQIAIVHTALCEDACRAIADLPLDTRRAFAEALHKQLGRIFVVKRWVECRRILLGQ